MTYAQASRTSGQAARRSPAVRFCPAVNLSSGETVAAFCEWPVMFGDQPRFGLPTREGGQPDATGWIVERIADMAHACEESGLRHRPVIVPVPPASLAGTAFAERCLQALSAGRLCPQEISLELADAVLATTAGDALSLVRGLRRHGFRVSYDARHSWCAPLPDSVWLMIDTVRVRAFPVTGDSRLRQRIETAEAAGVAIVAEGPHWRDGTALAEMGIRYATRPVADA